MIIFNLFNLSLIENLLQFKYYSVKNDFNKSPLL